MCNKRVAVLADNRKKNFKPILNILKMYYLNYSNNIYLYVPIRTKIIINNLIELSLDF